jgi:hypothetical protein
VRFGDHLYLRTWHDGYHGHWPDEMLFDLVADPHETHDLASVQPQRLAEGRERLEVWTAAQLEQSRQADPMRDVLAEGGPFHVRRHLGPYVERLRATGRAHWADVLVERHAAEL